MGPTEAATKRKNTSTPPEGYVCKLCSVAGHWIQQCPERQNQGRRKRKKKLSDHVPVPGVDPSDADIDAAREMQRIPPPQCKCGERSRLKKVKRSKVDETSRANGRYFFFCAKRREESCGFARAAKDELKKGRRSNGGKDNRAPKKVGAGDLLTRASAEKRVESGVDSSNRGGGSEVGDDASEKEAADGNSCKRDEAEKTEQKVDRSSDDENSSSSENDAESSSDSSSNKSGELAERLGAAKESKEESDDTSSDSSSSSDSDSDNETDEDDHVF